MSIIHVAKAAGVSTATVSRVMNDIPGVRSETVALVRAAIEELNYKPRRPSTPGPSAQPRRRRRSRIGSPSLSSDVGLRTGNIAVVTVGHTPQWLNRPILAEVMSGIQRGIGELGLRLMLEEMPDYFTPTSLMTQRQIDGAIVFLASHASGTGEKTFAAIRQHVPAVRVMGTSVASSATDHVTTDNVAIGQLAATHLCEAGCEHLAFLAANPEWALSRLRGQTFMNRASDDGLPTSAYLLTTDERAARSYGPNATASGEDDVIMDKLAADARAHGGKLGVFVCTDYDLAHFLPFMSRRGLVINRDFQLLSCDNEAARLTSMQPRPLSIDTGADEIGFRAVVRLLARIQRPDDRPLTIMVSPRIGKPDEI